MIPNFTSTIIQPRCCDATVARHGAVHRHLPQHRAVGAVVGVGRHRTDPEPRRFPEIPGDPPGTGWGPVGDRLGRPPTGPTGGWNPVKPKPGDEAREI